jgi:uncharacterized integral membrane protein
MRIFTWFVRLLVFVLLLAFAAKNTDPVALHFYFDLVWKAPLVAVLLAFFAAGALLGLGAVLAALLRQRRELHRLRRAAGASERALVPSAPSPPSPAEG